MDRDQHVRMLLGALVLGGLSATEERAVRAHLEICGECQAEHDELACVPGWLDLLAEAGPADEPAAGGSPGQATRRGGAARPLRPRRPPRDRRA
jgi:anti-sigma factor RsiW